MFTRKQFMSLYEQSVGKMKQLKLSNDKFNKNIGIQNDIYLFKQIQHENPHFERSLEDLEQIIKKLQMNYLDPDTARKVGTLKQQLKGQKDRRSHLNSNLKINAQLQSNNNRSINISLQRTYPMSTELSHNYSQKQHLPTRTTSFQDDKSHFHKYIYEDTQLEEEILRSKSKAITQLQQSFLSIHNISLQTHRMTVQQGEKIDVIDQEIIKTHTNAKQANRQLEEAQVYQRKSKKKYIVGSIFIILLSIALIVIVTV